MTLRRTLATAVAAAALVAPAAQAQPADIHAPLARAAARSQSPDMHAAVAQSAAKAQRAQDLRSPDARDAGQSLRRTGPTWAEPAHLPPAGQPTWSEDPPPVTPRAPA